MFDIKPLEEEWKLYKKERRKPWYKVFIFLFLLGIGFSLKFFIPIDIDLFKEKTAQLWDNFSTEKKEKIKEVSYEVLVNPSLYTLQKKPKSQIVKPKKIDSLNGLIEIPLLGEERVIKSELKKRKKLTINMIDSENIGVYQTIEKRFFDAHDIDDALFLAKSYFLQKNYKKSEYWALQVNKLDPLVEESLFIFVKSKVKLGKRNEGQAILLAYLKKTNSKEAKKLLYKIKKNKL